MTEQRNTDDTAAKVSPEIAERIDALMNAPPAERPTITVVGDDAVSSINLPKRPSRPA